MIIRPLLFLVLALCGLCRAEDSETLVLRNEVVDKLSIRQAGTLARTTAREDFEAGRYRLLYFTKEVVFGKGIFNDAPEEYLQKHYGVKCLFNGVEQTDPMLNAVEVYNETMVKLLIAKFKKDIFEEALRETKR